MLKKGSLKGQRNIHNRMSHRSSVAKLGPKQVLWSKPFSFEQWFCTMRSPSRIMHGDGPRARTQQPMPPPGLHVEKFSGEACAPLNSPEFTECSRAHLEETPGSLRRGGVTGIWRTPSSPGYGCRRVEKPKLFLLHVTFLEASKLWPFTKIAKRMNLSNRCVVKIVTSMWSTCVGEGTDGCGSGHKVVLHHEVKAEFVNCDVCFCLRFHALTTTLPSDTQIPGVLAK